MSLTEQRWFLTLHTTAAQDEGEGQLVQCRVILDALSMELIKRYRQCYLLHYQQPTGAHWMGQAAAFNEMREQLGRELADMVLRFLNVEFAELERAD